MYQDVSLPCCNVCSLFPPPCYPCCPHHQASVRTSTPSVELQSWATSSPNEPVILIPTTGPWGGEELLAEVKPEASQSSWSAQRSGESRSA